jgi:hypothetical protein
MMKPTSVLLLAASMLLFFGCAQEKPEEAAQKIFEQQLQAAAHEGLQMDPSGLDYDIVAEGDGRALVEVTGLMPVKATLPLVKQKGQWILDKSSGPNAEKAEPRSH